MAPGSPKKDGRSSPKKKDGTGLLSLKGGELLLDRYLIDDGPPLGTGGWCVVRRAEDMHDDNKPVAVKTFSSQAVREIGAEALLARFQQEIKTFEAIGVAPSSSSTLSGEGVNPRDFFVNLLDYSRSEGQSVPGPAPDGRLYTILELGDDSLDSWLRRQANERNSVDLDRLKDIARSLAQGLSWLHKLNLCHLDVKPENMMLFGNKWKLIDLESCMSLHGDNRVSKGSFTPLYAAPELARFALGELREADGKEDRRGLAPDRAMDVWAAGVVLLDILAHKAAFEETKAGFDAAALFEEEAVPFEGWYRWLASEEHIAVEELLSDVPEGKTTLERSPELKNLIGRLLQKESKMRISAEEMLTDPLLKSKVSNHRSQVEQVFQKWDKGSGHGSDIFRKLFVEVGLTEKEADLLVEAMCPGSSKRNLTFREFLDFVFPQN